MTGSAYCEPGRRDFVFTHGGWCAGWCAAVYMYGAELAIATVTSYSVAFGLLALAVGLVGGWWALATLARPGH
jgi:hypothetical protein